jgi:hypothetical protein
LPAERLLKRRFNKAGGTFPSCLEHALLRRASGAADLRLMRLPGGIVY